MRHTRSAASGCHDQTHMATSWASKWVSIMLDSWASTARMTVFAVVLVIAILVTLWLLRLELAIGPIHIQR